VSAYFSERRPWGDAEFRRFAFRVGLFMRRGLPAAEAEQLADMLAARDQARDERRLCLECGQRQDDGGCAAARRGAIPGQRRMVCLPLLQRCEAFAWVKP
jgi:hypothetical protein